MSSLSMNRHTFQTGHIVGVVLVAVVGVIVIFFTLRKSCNGQNRHRFRNTNARRYQAALRGQQTQDLELAQRRDRLRRSRKSSAEDGHPAPPPTYHEALSDDRPPLSPVAPPPVWTSTRRVWGNTLYQGKGIVAICQTTLVAVLHMKGLSDDFAGTESSLEWFFFQLRMGTKPVFLRDEILLEPFDGWKSLIRAIESIDD